MNFRYAMKNFRLDQVAPLLRCVARELIVPRWQQLKAEDVDLKAPDEWVTVVDREVEQWLTRELKALLPGSMVIGEEQCALTPQLLDSVDQGLVWLLDPIDGTGNFVSGTGPVSLMVALLENGETMASWMLNPLTGVLHHAIKGGGAWQEAQAVAASQIPPPCGQGIIKTRFLPQRLKDHLAQDSKGAVFQAGSNCAGDDYPKVMLGGSDFALYWRVLPWDHAPGALFVSEAGGVVARLDGSAYQPGLQNTGLLVARNQQLWAQARALFPEDCE